MITFERTQDMDTVQRILTHPLIYSVGSDDFAPDPNNWSPPQSDHLYYILAKEDGAPIGLFILISISPVLWRVDLCFLPKAWGSLAGFAARGFMEWLWGSTSCQRLIGEIPDYNKRAVRYGTLMGMKKFGENPGSYLKKGKLHSLVLMGISRPKEKTACLQ